MTTSCDTGPQTIPMALTRSPECSIDFRVSGDFALKTTPLHSRLLRLRGRTIAKNRDHRKAAARQFFSALFSTRLMKILDSSACYSRLKFNLPHGTSATSCACYSPNMPFSDPHLYKIAGRPWIQSFTMIQRNYSQYRRVIGTSTIEKVAPSNRVLQHVSLETMPFYRRISAQIGCKETQAHFIITRFLGHPYIYTV